MTPYLLVALGGALGAPLRYLTDRALTRRIPGSVGWGTVTVNLAGSLLLGILLGATSDPALLAVLGTGFCGALTTWSTFAGENVRLWQSGSRRRVLLVVGGTMVLGLAAAALGFRLGRLAA